MMHCGGCPSTRCLSGKELRPSGHSGRRMSGCEQHHHCSVRSCTPTVQQLAPSDSQQSGSEITQAVGRSQKKNGTPRAGRALYATAHISSSPLAGDVLSFCTQRSTRYSVDVTFTTDKKNAGINIKNQTSYGLEIILQSTSNRLSAHGTVDGRALEDERSCRNCRRVSCVRSSNAVRASCCTAHAGGFVACMYIA